MGEKALTGLSITNFTAFAELELEFSAGINVFIGENATGKTHLLKLLYCACEITRERGDTVGGFPRKVLDAFLPYGRLFRRLVHHGAATADVIVRSADRALDFNITVSPPAFMPGAVSYEESDWCETRIDSAYIPSKEMLANAPGFLALYATREIFFEEVYRDIIARAYLPRLRELPDHAMAQVLDRIKETLGGEVTTKEEYFFLKQNGIELEFTLLAEGLRKIGLLGQLIANGTIRPGTILFWDEPETNLNPRLLGTAVDVLLELQRAGVQVFLATHNYVVLKELDLRTGAEDRVRYHSLYRDPIQHHIRCKSTDNYQAIDPNLIVNTLVNLYERDVERDFSDADQSPEGLGGAI